MTKHDDIESKIDLAKLNTKLNTVLGLVALMWPSLVAYAAWEHHRVEQVRDIAVAAQNGVQVVDSHGPKIVKDKAENHHSSQSMKCHANLDGQGKVQ